jgi:hypothetical protein
MAECALCGALSRIEIKIVKAFAWGKVQCGDGRRKVHVNQLFRPMPWPPEFRTCSGVSEKFSEMSEKSVFRSRRCSRFITGDFFAFELHNSKCSRRDYRDTNSIRCYEISGYRFEILEPSK